MALESQKKAPLYNVIGNQYEAIVCVHLYPNLARYKVDGQNVFSEDFVYKLGIIQSIIESVIGNLMWLITVMFEAIRMIARMTY